MAGPRGIEPLTYGLRVYDNLRFSSFPSLNWLEVREQFVQWLDNQGYNENWKYNMVNYLNRYMTVIRGPSDIIELFSKVKAAKRHVVFSLRTLFNFYEAIGYSEAQFDVLRKALPKTQCGRDLKIPSEQQIVDSLRKLSKAPVKYQALYNLLVDSGLRLVEACELINNFKDGEALNGFYRCEVSMFRGEKQAYYGHFTEKTMDLIKQVKDKLNYVTASSYYRKRDYVLAKYLRKFAFDKMIELEVPESVADFIEGRVPQRIGAKHYLALARQSSKYYPRYQAYIEKLKA